MPRAPTAPAQLPADLSALRRRGRPAGPAPMCTVQEAAAALAVPVPTVYGWTRERMHDGKPVLPVVKLGSRVRLRVSDVDRLPDRLALRARPAVSFFTKPNRGRKAGSSSAAAANVEQFSSTPHPAGQASASTQPGMDSAGRGKSAFGAESGASGPELGGIEAGEAALHGVGDSESPDPSTQIVDSEGASSVLPDQLPIATAERTGCQGAGPGAGACLTTGGEGVGRERAAPLMNPSAQEENFHIALGSA